MRLDPATEESIRESIATNDEEPVEREQRIQRRMWLSENFPAERTDYLSLDGWLSHALLAEIRSCFTYGHFFATVVLAATFLERALAVRFYATGQNSLDGANGVQLLRAARMAGWVSNEELDQFNRLRRLRNPVVYFREPLTPETIEARATNRNEQPADVLEQDAREILQVVFRVLAMGPV